MTATNLGTRLTLIGLATVAVYSTHFSTSIFTSPCDGDDDCGLVNEQKQLVNWFQSILAKNRKEVWGGLTCHRRAIEVSREGEDVGRGLDMGCLESGEGYYGPAAPCRPRSRPRSPPWPRPR